jgi:hypothetical protein
MGKSFLYPEGLIKLIYLTPDIQHPASNIRNRHLTPDLQNQNLNFGSLQLYTLIIPIFAYSVLSTMWIWF